MRQRSDKTEIRHLRTTLRNARTCLLVQIDPNTSAGFKSDFARDMERMIREALATKRRPGAPSRQRRAK